MYALARIIAVFPFAVAAMVYLWVRATHWYSHYQQAAGVSEKEDLAPTYFMPMQNIPPQQEAELKNIRRRFLRNKRAFFAILTLYFLWFVGNFLFG